MTYKFPENIHQIKYSFLYNVHILSAQTYNSKVCMHMHAETMCINVAMLFR